MSLKNLEIEFDEEDSVEETEQADSKLDVSFSTTAAHNLKEIMSKDTSVDGSPLDEKTVKDNALFGQFQEMEVEGIGGFEDDFELAESSEDATNVTPISEAFNYKDEEETSREETVTQVSQAPVSHGSAAVAMAPVQAVAAQPVVIDNSKEIERLRAELYELRGEVHERDVEAQTKIAVLECEKKMILKYLSETKKLDTNVTKVLSHIVKKAPALKKEVQMIKKMLQDFTKSSLPDDESNS